MRPPWRSPAPGLPHAGAVLDLDRGVAEAARRIGLTVRTEIPVSADGAR